MQERSLGVSKRKVCLVWSEVFQLSDLSPGAQFEALCVIGDKGHSGSSDCGHTNELSTPFSWAKARPFENAF